MEHSRFIKELGKELKNARINKKLTQQDVANRFNCSRVMIANYERGERSIEIEFFFKLCELYGVDDYEIIQKIRKYMYR